MYCKVIRFSRTNDTPDQPSITRGFDMVIDAYVLQNGIISSLSLLPECERRSGLMITARDAQGFLFICNQSIMLTTRGKINETYSDNEKNSLHDTKLESSNAS